MGDRVAQSGRPDLSRANRLKEALERGAPPAFVTPADTSTPENPSPEPSASPANASCTEHSCPVPPLPESFPSDQPPLQFLQQMFQASPDGLSIADSDHRVLWANETFVRMFHYEAAEVVGQSLENLVVPPERLAESRWVTEALAKGERLMLETQRRKKDGTPARCVFVVCPSAAGRKDGGLLRRIPRHCRPQAGRGAEFRALSRRRKEQQRPRAAAILCRRTRHCRRVDVCPQLLHCVLRSLHRVAHVSVLRR